MDAESSMIPAPGQATPGRRPPAWAITAGLVGTVLVALAGLVLTGLEWSSLATSDAIGNVGAEAGAVAYAVLGALIVRRAGNLVGWFMLAEGAANAVVTTGSAYAIFGVKAHPGTLPVAAAAGTLAETVFVLVGAALSAIFLVFPSGRLPSPRWRPAVTAGLVLTGLSLASFVVSTRTVALPAVGGISLTYSNPLAVRALQPVTWLGTLNGLTLLFPLLLGGALVSLALRYRRGDQRLRQQMKWLALAIAGLLICIVVGSLASAVGQANKPLQQVAYALTPWLVYLAIPAATAIAILRRRLFDIDVIISRALLVTLLSAGVTAVYAAIVFGIGTFVGHRRDPLLTIAAAVAIALLFQPLRQRATRLANRLVYGERATPYQVLSDFAADRAGQLDLGGALDRMVSLLGGASGASRVEAWIRVGAELRPGAVWPGGSAPSAALRLNGPAAQRLNGLAELPVPDPSARIVPVRHGDDLLGAISLTKPPNEPLTSTEDSLLQHLASQASLVMRNAQLTAELRATIDELRASRRRLVEAQDAERRKIERNLHDGAQQQLIALAIHLGLLAESADDPEFIRQAVPDLKAQLSAALDDLRALARGIYPPLLAEQGLVMALRAQVARSPVPALLEADEIGRYPQDTESTVYFCALEALQNVAKHAQASRAAVRLFSSDGTLEFSVSDDGAGFPAGTSHGSGLQGMSDRVAAHGGTLTVRSRPGQGTTITGRLPTSERTAAGLRPASLG
ncbi:MAG TPA: GAF domain-containing sensor histidine kinase [Streptosporangiaceae bacterium]|nr:GAF domain-containing sensor histidine kinase [Streptosporangiaceae bacterium]